MNNNMQILKYITDSEKLLMSDYTPGNNLNLFPKNKCVNCVSD